MQYTPDNILVKPGVFPDDPDLILSITPEQAGWEYISFQARRLTANHSWSFASAGNELVIVNLSGRYTVRSNRGQWSGIGTRKNVFKGAAHALYLPRHSEFTITAEERIRNGLTVWRTAFKYLLGMATVNDAITIINILHNNAHIKKSRIIRERLESSLTLLAIDVAFSGNNKIDSNVILGAKSK